MLFFVYNIEPYAQLLSKIKLKRFVFSFSPPFGTSKRNDTISREWGDKNIRIRNNRNMHSKIETWIKTLNIDRKSIKAI